ncbi:hypothetical protein HDU67_001667 [Dinochytrium kinnereticum]|nr:hypothetical protein HDU67_001667 [Dinochytrium kinnereticum]
MQALASKPKVQANPSNPLPPLFNTSTSNITGWENLELCVRSGDSPSKPFQVPISGEPQPSLFGRLNPGPEVLWWGGEIDWEADTPTTMKVRLNQTPAVITASVDVYDTGFDANQVTWKAREISRIGSMMHLRVIPGSAIETIDDNILLEIARLMRQINMEYRLPIFLNYAPEMNDATNGPYGMKPRAFIQSFQSLTNLLRFETNMTAMVWSPKSSEGYPGQRTVPYDDETLNLLDTDFNGFVNDNDDAYGPFYPGDEFVDWVGLTHTPTSESSLSTPLRQILQSGPQTPLKNFYSRFSATPLKPLLLTTAIGYTHNATIFSIQEEISVKRDWWGQWMGIRNEMPNVRLVNGVERVRGAFDFSVGEKGEVRDAFLRDAGRAGVGWGRVEVSCRGDVLVKI